MHFKILYAISWILFPAISFCQNVGIGTGTPTEKLHVVGNIKSDGIKTSSLQLSANAGTGKVLTSDASGNASWQASSASGSTSGNLGYGVWGDCATNANIADYHPLTEPGNEQHDFMGISVAVSGNYAIVASYGDDVNGNANQGSVSFYHYNGSSWDFMQKVTDVTGLASDGFGFSVAISGNYAIVGIYLDDVNGFTNAGSAIIYYFDGNSWVFMQRLTDVGSIATEDNFGCSVSISGNYALVGINFDDPGGNANQGAAALYQLVGNTWNFVSKFTDPGGLPGDNFGTSVFISGNYAIVGAPKNDIGVNNDQGTATIFQYFSNNWFFMQTISDPLGAANDNFGSSVSVSGTTAAVGINNDDNAGGADQGSACIFQFNGSTWAHIQKLYDPAGNTDDHFGNSVFISGNYLIVGAQGEDVGANTSQGSATIFTRVGAGWQKLQYITDPGGARDDYFGCSVAIDSATKNFLIGAFGYISAAGKVLAGRLR